MLHGERECNFKLKRNMKKRGGGGGAVQAFFLYNKEKNYEVQNVIAVTLNDISFRKSFFSTILQRYLPTRIRLLKSFSKTLVCLSVCNSPILIA